MVARRGTAGVDGLGPGMAVWRNDVERKKDLDCGEIKSFLKSSSLSPHCELEPVLIFIILILKTFHEERLSKKYWKHFNSRAVELFLV